MKEDMQATDSKSLPVEEDHLNCIRRSSRSNPTHRYPLFRFLLGIFHELTPTSSQKDGTKQTQKDGERGERDLVSAGYDQVTS